MLSPVLSSAAWAGEPELFDGLLSALKSSEDPQQRRMILVGLGSSTIQRWCGKLSRSGSIRTRYAGDVSRLAPQFSSADRQTE